MNLAKCLMGLLIKTRPSSLGGKMEAVPFAATILIGISMVKKEKTMKREKEQGMEVPNDS